MKGRVYWGGTTALLVGGVLLIGYSVREQRARDAADASILFAAFDDKPEVSDREAQALTELTRARYGVRAAFVRSALAEKAPAVRFGVHLHALSIAVSQVDRREARELFDDALSPCLGRTVDPSILQVCMSLISRWGFLAAAAEDNADDVVSLLVKERDPYVKRALTVAVRGFAPHVAPKKADELTERLLRAIAGNFDRAQLAPLLGAMQELATPATVAVKTEAARTLVQRLAFEKEPAMLPAWAGALDPLGPAISENDANDLAGQLLKRIESETRSAALLPLMTALNSFAPKVDADHAEQIAAVLIPRLGRADLVSLQNETKSIVLLAKALRPEALEQARSVMMDRLRNETDPKAMAMIGFNLGELSEGIAQGDFDGAVTILVDKISRQDGSYELTMLDLALRNLVRAGISPETAGNAARDLGDRIEREQHIPEFLRVAVGIEILASSIPERSSEPLVARLIDRMRESSGASVVRALAFVIGDLDASRTQVLNATKKLTQRIATENDAAALRDLVAGLLNLGDDVPEDVFEDAEERAKKLLLTERSDKGRDDLTATLTALEDREDESDGPKEEGTAPALDETIARQLLDPLLDQEDWQPLALAVAPVNSGREAGDEGDADEESADFYTLLVEDDDGESETGGSAAYPIDFARLSDALDRFRPQRESTQTMTRTMVTGSGLTIVATLLVLAGLRRRTA